MHAIRQISDRLDLARVEEVYAVLRTVLVEPDDALRLTVLEALWITVWATRERVRIKGTLPEDVVGRANGTETQRLPFRGAKSLEGSR